MTQCQLVPFGRIPCPVVPLQPQVPVLLRGSMNSRSTGRQVSVMAKRRLEQFVLDAFDYNSEVVC
jgi:hypothetical protein